MDRQFFTDLKNNDAGLLENALPMVTGAVAEPVAGIAAMYHAVTGGHDASGVVNAIRDAMTYQPRTDAGKMYQQALGSAVNRIVQSAPVRTWQKGVDIAGQYSPAAGAILQTVPAAIGTAAGVKPALRAGRAVSGALDRVENFAPSGTGAVIGLQKGMIDPSILKAGDPVRDTKFGDAYEYIGADPANAERALVREGKVEFSVDMNRLESIQAGKGKKPQGMALSPKNKTRLYHGSYYEWPENQLIGEGSRDMFGGIFTSKGGIEPAYSGHSYYVDIPDHKILTQGDIDYRVSMEKQYRALERATGISRKDPKFKAVYDAVVGQESQKNWFGDQNEIVSGSFADAMKDDMPRYGNIQGDAGWEAQRLRGKFAKELGFDAVEMSDETGTSVLVVKKTKPLKMEKGD